jgi:hypothetical protein
LRPSHFVDQRMTAGSDIDMDKTHWQTKNRYIIYKQTLFYIIYKQALFYIDRQTDRQMDRHFYK